MQSTEPAQQRVRGDHRGFGPLPGHATHRGSKPVMETVGKSGGASSFGLIAASPALDETSQQRHEREDEPLHQNLEALVSQESEALSSQGVQVIMT